MIFPDFIIVGAMKCGSTSLHNYLNSHKDISMSTIKAPDYFSKFSKVNNDEYSKLFDKRSKVKGESSINYLLYPDSAKLIKQSIPNCKIIIILRNPTNRAYSQHISDSIENPKTTQDNFNKKIISDMTTININDTQFHNYIQRGLYSYQVKRYIDLFEDVHIIFFEDFVRNTEKVVSNVLEFIGVDNDITFENKKHGSGFITNTNFINFVRIPLVKKIATLFPESLYLPIYKKFRVTKQKPLPILKKDKKLLDEFYWHDILKLEQIIGQNTNWYFKCEH